MLWRLTWALRQFVELDAYRKHTEALEYPRQFYSTLLAKLIPGISALTTSLHLKDGRVIPVEQLMTLYIYKEIFAERCYDIELDRADPRILDVGANTGLFTLRMKQLYPRARITCFEPFPPNVAALEETVRRNNLTEVSLIPKALGARTGTAKLYLHKRNVGGHSFSPIQASSHDAIDVEVVDLASVLAGIPGEVDLLKLDCEGAEFEILTQVDEAAAQRLRNVLVEPMPRLYDVRLLLDRMAMLGFRRRWRDGLYHFWRE